MKKLKTTYSIPNFPDLGLQEMSTTVDGALTDRGASVS